MKVNPCPLPRLSRCRPPTSRLLAAFCWLRSLLDPLADEWGGELVALKISER